MGVEIFALDFIGAELGPTIGRTHDYLILDRAVSHGGVDQDEPSDPIGKTRIVEYIELNVERLERWLNTDPGLYEDADKGLRERIAAAKAKGAEQFYVLVAS